MNKAIGIFMLIARLLESIMPAYLKNDNTIPMKFTVYDIEYATVLFSFGYDRFKRYKQYASVLSKIIFIGLFDIQSLSDDDYFIIDSEAKSA